MTNFDPSKSADDFTSSTRHLGMNAQELLMQCMEDESTCYSNRYGSYMTSFFYFLDPDAFTNIISDADINSFQKKVLDASMKYLSTIKNLQASTKTGETGKIATKKGRME